MTCLTMVSMFVTVVYNTALRNEVGMLVNDVYKMNTRHRSNEPFDSVLMCEVKIHMTLKSGSTLEMCLRPSGASTSSMKLYHGRLATSDGVHETRRVVVLFATVFQAIDNKAGPGVVSE